MYWSISWSTFIGQCYQLVDYNFYIFSLSLICVRLQLLENFHSLLACADAIIFHLSLGCPEHMTRALRGTLMCTSITPKFKRHSMRMLLEFLTLGKPAGLSLNVAGYISYHLLLIITGFSILWAFFQSYVHELFPCSDIVGNYWADSPRSMLPIYQELIAAGIRIWVFR